MPVSVARTGTNLQNGNFIPEIWSRKLNVKYYKSTFLMDICNTKWEGEIKGQGGKVMIRVRPTVNIGDYTVNGTITYQNLVDNKVELPIDKAKFFAFKVDDIDQAQADINIINETTQDAAMQMKIAIETNVLGAIYADAGTNQASLALTSSNVLDWIIDQEVVLDQNNVPTDGRWLIVPPKVAGLLQKSDLRQVQITGDNKSILRNDVHNGKLGNIASFSVYVSNCLDVTGTTTLTTHCMSGQKDAVTYASQVTKVETTRLDNTFGDAIRGLNVYGFKVVEPSGLIHAPVTFA